MPRPRQHHTGLPPRLYRHGAGYRYVPRMGKPVALGADLAAALHQYRIIKEQESGEGRSTEWLIGWYLANLPTLAPRNKPRTIADKHTDARELIQRLGHIPFAEMAPPHIRQYLDLGIAEARATRANREAALLSHVFSCAREQGIAQENPCARVRRNRETPADRYHEDAEALAILARCNAMTWGVAMLIYRTLQRPADILGWTVANIIERDGARILSFIQSKTAARVEIAITPELDEILARLRTGRKIVGMTIVHNRRGQAYTENGLRAMWTAAKRRAGIAAPFGIYDFKAKGATEMYSAGVPIETICQLCGHDSVTTTETYIKRHLRRVIQPNGRRMSA